MQKLLLSSIALFFLVHAEAQSTLGSQLEKAKFEIVKKTVEFLSTDTATFKNVKAKSCTGCDEYGDLKKFAADNGLLNADKKIIEPLSKIPVDTTADKWSGDLSRFSQAAINSVAGAGKEKRRSLPTFNDYEQDLTDIKNSITVRNEAGSEKNASANNGRQATATNKTVAESNVSTNTRQWLPYGIAIILLALLVYAWVENNKNKQKKEHLKKEKSRLESELLYAQQDIGKLKKEISVLEENAKDAELDIQFYKDRLEQIEKQDKPAPGTKITAQKGHAVVEEPVSAKPAKAPQNIPAGVTKYSRYADLSDGFSNAELLDNPDGETIFELTILPNNTGTYKIVNNATGQKYALSNAQYFLGKTCRYDSFPGTNTKIITEELGQIKLAAGKWTITHPAKISFSS